MVAEHDGIENMEGAAEARLRGGMVLARIATTGS